MKKAIHLPTYIVPILHFSTLKASIDLRLHIYVFFFPLGCIGYLDVQEVLW